jgi:hypothetical protein
MDERARRVGQNEALFRAVNEQIEEVTTDYGLQTMSIVCECGDVSCAERVEVDVGTYERVRTDSTQFILVPGHEIEDVEDVIERNDRFEIVSKRSGGAAQLAAETDPRR